MKIKGRLEYFNYHFPDGHYFSKKYSEIILPEEVPIIQRKDSFIVDSTIIGKIHPKKDEKGVVFTGIIDDQYEDLVRSFNFGIDGFYIRILHSKNRNGYWRVDRAQLHHIFLTNSPIHKDYKLEIIEEGEGSDADKL